MKKRIFILNLLLAILICLSGCGSEEEKTVMTQGGGSSSGSSDFMDSSRSYIDYSDVAIAGGLTDYSYVFSAEAYVDSKAPINDFYNELEKYILSKNGYIEKMNTDYSTYDKPNFKGMSYAQKQYAIKAIENKAYGYCNFTIQIDEDYSDTVIYRLNEFCNSNNFTVKEYMKNGTNYQAYLVVADFKTTDKDKKQITRQDLEQRLKYSSIEVKLSYKIKRTGFDAINVKLDEFGYTFLNETKDTIIFILELLAIAGVFVFCILIPCSKAYKKSMYKYYTKHPEYNICKKVIIDKDIK